MHIGIEKCKGFQGSRAGPKPRLILDPFGHVTSPCYISKISAEFSKPPATGLLLVYAGADPELPLGGGTNHHPGAPTE